MNYINRLYHIFLILHSQRKHIMDDKYKCSSCNWQGKESDLEYDETETCFGIDRIEICPVCGSYEVKRVFVDKTE